MASSSCNYSKQERGGDRSKSAEGKKSTTIVHESLMLETNQKIDKLEKIYWSRKFNKILARLSIREDDRQAVRDLGRSRGRGR